MEAAMVSEMLEDFVSIGRSNRRPTFVAQIVFAVVATGLSCLIRFFASEAAHLDCRYLIFFAAVIFSSWLFGWKSGLISMFLATLFGEVILTQHHYKLDYGLTTFVLESLSCIWLAQWVKHRQLIAEAANAAKDNFLAILSHELRTPLTPVMATVSIMLRTPSLTEEQKSDLNLIYRNIELESHLVDDLLDITRVSRGMLHLNMKKLDMHDIIRKCIETIEHSAKEKSISVVMNLRAAHPVVNGDEQRLQQVVWILLNNSLKFTPKDGQIIVHTRNKGNNIEIAVEDNGCGITSEAMPKLFVPFEQGDVRIGATFGGLGLGLSIAKSLVVAHKGKIVVESEGKDKGAIFTMSLKHELETEPLNIMRPQISDVIIGHSKSLLLVEDHDDTSTVMRRVLTMVGYKVDTANNVANAFAKVTQKEYDLMISDIGLPDGTGHDLMRKIEHRLGHHIKAVALSGFGQADDVNQSLSAGFLKHIKKPVNMDKFLAEINEVIMSGESQPAL
jgi:signal transduction histidine kinase/ActR/RegA family two-component response regulator